jgi:hypothetical protein
MKRPNLQIMGTEEEELIKTKETNKLFNKIIAETFSNLEKEWLIKMQEAYRTTNPSGPKHKHSQIFDNQNNKYTKESRNIESCKRQKEKSHIKANPIE